MNITIIDYGAGNLRSLVNSLRAIGCEPRLAETPAELAGAQRLILPGVGAFGDCLSEIDRRGFTEPVRKWFRAGKPFFGICVGYQALFEGSEESPKQPGLALLPGRVRRFPSSASGEWKIPHMGWNQVEPLNPNHLLWQGFSPQPYFYFVHSYYPELSGFKEASSSVEQVKEVRAAALVEYAGRRFVTVAANPEGSQVATQFHPEKSQNAGLKLLSNWLELTDGR